MSASTARTAGATTAATTAATARAARTAGAAGLVAATAYVATTVAGALSYPGYSHVSDSVSELTSSLAPHRVPLAVGYVLYNLACAAFGWGLWRTVPRSRLLRAVAWLSVAGAVAGIGQVTWFPQDTIGDGGTSGAVSAAGQVHLVLAGLSAALTVATTVLAALAFRRAHAAWPARASVACAAAILVTGPVAAASVGSEVMGLCERLPIGAFLVWLVLMAAWALRAGRVVEEP